MSWTEAPLGRPLPPLPPLRQGGALLLLPTTWLQHLHCTAVQSAAARASDWWWSPLLPLCSLRAQKVGHARTLWLQVTGLVSVLAWLWRGPYGAAVSSAGLAILPRWVPWWLPA
jgi:hypothetical protein